WALARFAPGLFSYRVYTIWATFHVCFLLLIGASIIDVCHVSWRLPIRQAAAAALAIYVLFLLGPSPMVDPSGEKKQQFEVSAQEEPQDWYGQLEARIKATDERAPVVFVAASGGGSRAALFTALVYEHLQREKLTTSHGKELTTSRGRELTWADQIV